MIRLINIVAIALFIMLIIILFKFNLVCEVTINGQSVGYIADKEAFEAKVNEIINKEEEAKLFTTIEYMPEYQLKFVDKTEQTNEEVILAKLEDSSETTYQLYAVTLDGEEKAVLSSLEEAEKIVDEMTEKYEDDIELDIGITDKITTDKEENTVKVATASIDDEIEEKKEEIEAEIEKQKEIESHTVRGVYLEVTPVSGTITSRFGNRESIRSSSHTGLDIATATESGLLTVIKNNCQVSKKMQSQMDMLSKYELAQELNQRKPKKIEREQELVEQTMTRNENQDALKSYITTFNVIEEKEEFLQTAKQTMSAIDFARLVSQLQLQTISNLQELENMEKECNSIEDLHELQQEVSIEYERLQLITRTIKEEVPRHILYKVIGGETK